jgi:ABC-type branched-subunit amino acid transport system substrate-binding protein
MAEQVQVVRSSTPDAVICIGAYAACAAFIRDAREAGLEVPIANVSFVGSESLLTLLREAGAAQIRD